MKEEEKLNQTLDYRYLYVNIAYASVFVSNNI